MWWLESIHTCAPRKPPSEAEREALVIGDGAELMFAVRAKKGGPVRYEVLTVGVVSIEGEVYRGKLAQPPKVNKKLKAGDEVIFGAMHVVGIDNAWRASS